MDRPPSLDFNNMEDREALIGRKPHCEDDFGGSHYHCGRCGKVSSMQGHFMGVHWKNGKPVHVSNHFCCPLNCELDDSTGKN